MIRLKPNDPRLPTELRQAPRNRQRKPKADPAAFIALCVAAGLPAPIPEYRFALPRRWRFDFAFRWWNHHGGVALEVEGGIWLSAHGKKSRHFHAKGALDDMKKYNEAAIRGWRVLRVTRQQFDRGDAITLVRRALGME